MRPDVETGMYVEFEELFALKDRLRQVADNVRLRLVQAGLQEQLEMDVFDDELELRGPEGSGLQVRLDSYHLEINGAPPTLHTHVLAAHLLDEAGVFRITSVEAAYQQRVKVSRKLPLNMVAQAFGPFSGGAPMLGRRFGMTWEWGDATTGYSLMVTSVEDREIEIAFKAREGYMTLPELQEGAWVRLQQERCRGAITRLVHLFGWE